MALVASIWAERCNPATYFDTFSPKGYCEEAGLRGRLEVRGDVSEVSARRPRQCHHIVWPSDGRPSLVSLVRVVGHLVDRDSDREDEAIVLARGGLDTVGVAQREPALRYAGDRVFSAAELVLVSPFGRLGGGPYSRVGPGVAPLSQALVKR